MLHFPCFLRRFFESFNLLQKTMSQYSVGSDIYSINQQHRNPFHLIQKARAMVVLRLLKIRLPLIFRLLGGTTERAKMPEEKGANRNLPKETAKPAQPVQPQFPDRSANLWAERFVFLNCAQSQLVVFNLLAVQALNVKRQFGTLWSQQPTHTITLVKSNHYHTMYEILTPHNPKKANTNEESLPQRRWSPATLFSFLLRIKTKKKGKHWLTNKQGDIK